MKPINCLALIGVGLIGGSIGLGARKRGLAKRVVGAGSSRATLETAKSIGAIDEIAENSHSAAAAADLIILAAPVAKIASLACELAPVCAGGTLLTDVGSTKAAIVAEIELHAGNWPQGVRFIGSHPLAGNEKRGPQHGSADLLANRTVVVTPTTNTEADSLQQLTHFWTALGAIVVPMSPEDHDRALATTSHLPHLAASAIASVTPEEYVTLTASGWQDTTRIAAGDPELWRQIMLANRANLLAALAGYTHRLEAWRQALESADSTALEQLLREAKQIRDAVGN